MTQITRSITRDDRLKYIALMTMAAEHVREASRIEDAVHRLLGTEEGGHVADAVWGLKCPSPTIKELDNALLREGIGVSDNTQA